MADVGQALRDFLFPARQPLREAAEGPDPNAASKAATARAASNPSGIDVAAEAQKAAARTLPKPAASAATAAPVKKKAPGVAGKIGAQLMEQ